MMQIILKLNLIESVIIFLNRLINCNAQKPMSIAYVLKKLSIFF